jgi:hypothetical protein
LVEQRSNFPKRRPVDITGITGIIPEGDQDGDGTAATIDGPPREEGNDIVTQKCLEKGSRRIIGVRRAEGFDDEKGSCYLRKADLATAKPYRRGWSRKDRAWGIGRLLDSGRMKWNEVECGRRR